MAIIEYTCSECGKYEKIILSQSKVTEFDFCPLCGAECPRVEVSLPARRNPAHGIQI